MDRGSYSDARGELARSLEALAALAQVDQDACAWLRNKLREGVFNLVAAGQFKRGKSSVINALLGEALLPVGVVPLTSVVTEIRYGAEPSAEVVYESGARHPVGIDSLADYVTETGNPRNVKGVREVLIRFPSMWLESGVRLVDTPGIGSVYEHNNDVTQRYLPQADAVLFVGSVDQPMSRAELEFLESIRPYAAKIFCLLNKTDYLSAKELEESLAFSARAIETALGVAIPLYPVSARLALAAKCESDAAGQTRSGFPPFERMLRAFMTDDKELIWLKSIAQSALRILAQARLQVNLELAALAAPLEQVERNLVAFIDKKQETLTARAEYCVLIEANARDLQKQQVEPALDRLKREQQSRAIGLIDQWAEGLASLGLRALQEALEHRISSEVRVAYDGWIADQEPKAVQAFERICDRFWRDIQATVNELLSYSASLFNLEFQAAAQPRLWNAQSGFTYKFWYEPVGLKSVTSSLIMVLPKAIGRRLIIAEMRRRAEELIEIHAGRIRHDFEERLKANAASFCRELLTRIDATVSGMEGAIDSAMRQRQRGEEQARRRGVELTAAASLMSGLERRMQQLMQRAQPEVTA